jgi:hypothetical protein
MHKKEKHRKTFLIHPAFQLTGGGAWNHVPIVTMAQGTHSPPLFTYFQ